MKIDSLINEIDQLVRPIAVELDYEIYYIEYVKENGEYYLRIYIDKEEGRISLSDCEAMSRRVSEIMDAKDPIKDAYFLEISSPGINRGIYTEEHYVKYVNSEVQIRFTKSLNGKKSIKGILKEVKENSIVIDAEEMIEIPKDKIKSANLEGEL